MRQKFGLGSVRIPGYLLDDLRQEYLEKGRKSSRRYCVRKAKKGEQERTRMTHVVYLCNVRGRRLSGARLHFFIPVRYPPRYQRQYQTGVLRHPPCDKQLSVYATV